LCRDTAFHFPETDALKGRFAKGYGLNVVDVKPLTDPGPLYQTAPDRCCAIRKVEPLARAIAGFDAWISAVRQDQSSTRSATELVEYHEVDGRPIVKVFPLAHWRGRTCGATSGKTACRITHCSTRATRASVAGRAPDPPHPAKPSARGGGATPARPSAGSTPSPSSRRSKW